MSHSACPSGTNSAAREKDSQTHRVSSRPRLTQEHRTGTAQWTWRCQTAGMYWSAVQDHSEKYTTQATEEEMEVYETCRCEGLAFALAWFWPGPHGEGGGQRTCKGRGQADSFQIDPSCQPPRGTPVTSDLWTVHLLPTAPPWGTQPSTCEFLVGGT